MNISFDEDDDGHSIRDTSPVHYTAGSMVSTSKLRINVILHFVYTGYAYRTIGICSL